jgi:hypothetical protein
VFALGLILQKSGLFGLVLGVTVVEKVEMLRGEQMIDVVGLVVCLLVGDGEILEVGPFGLISVGHTVGILRALVVGRLVGVLLSMVRRLGAEVIDVGWVVVLVVMLSVS